MTDTNQHHSGEVPIILPTPVAIVRPGESKFSILARFFAWATALCLSISVLVALVSVTAERNDLSSQLSCRATAGVAVNKAIINEQIALADHSVLTGKFVIAIIRTPQDDPNRAAIFEVIAQDIDKVDTELDKIGAQLRDAVQQQAVAVQSC